MPVGRIGVALARPPPDIVWLHRFGSSGDDYASGIAAGAAGHTYMADYTNGTLPGQNSSGKSDAFIAKLSRLLLPLQ
jgi:hypothetical protein